ncbi:aminotransferase class V-fold PLP-dependent enzyme [bacterium]|nr:aminotransferase class V-fold PLP-dependent enzyme [bacterium]
MRDELPALEELAYLDHALRGPMPARAVAASQRALAACARGALARDEQKASVEAARENVARILSCSRDEVAFVQNATAAVAAIAQGIRWKEGDRVVTNEGEFASNVLPWKALEERGVRVEVVALRDGRLELDDLSRALPGARLLAIGAVSLATGERRDLARAGALAREAGAFFFVDAAQALGVLRLSARALGIDALAASSRKWLLGPPETGVLHVRRERQAELQVASPGALSLEHPGDARRFEGGALAAPLLAGLAASTGLLLEVGLERVEALALERALEIERLALERGLAVLSPRDEGRSPIVRISPRAPLTEADLLSRGVVARVERSGAVRLSPHFWTSREDVERAVVAVSG